MIFFLDIYEVLFVFFCNYNIAHTKFMAILLWVKSDGFVIPSTSFVQNLYIVQTASQRSPVLLYDITYHIELDKTSLDRRFDKIQNDYRQFSTFLNQHFLP